MPYAVTTGFGSLADPSTAGPVGSRPGVRHSRVTHLGRRVFGYEQRPHLAAAVEVRAGELRRLFKVEPTEDAMTATKPEVVRITDDTPVATVLDVVEARTRRLMHELSTVPDQWPTRQAHAAVLAIVNDSIDEYNRLTLGR